MTGGFYSLRVPNSVSVCMHDSQWITQSSARISYTRRNELFYNDELIGHRRLLGLFFDSARPIRLRYLVKWSQRWTTSVSCVYCGIRLQNDRDRWKGFPLKPPASKVSPLGIPTLTWEPLSENVDWFFFFYRKFMFEELLVQNQHILLESCQYHCIGWGRFHVYITFPVQHFLKL